MTFPRAHLVVSACLFFGWLSFLFYLVLRSPSIILSKPQFLTASLYVVAEVHAQKSGPSPQILIEEVLWSAQASEQQLVGQKLTLAELSVYQKQQGFVGEGKYLIPLIKQSSAAGTEYLVAPVPHLKFDPTPSALRTLLVKDLGRDKAQLQLVGATSVGMLAAPGGEAPLLVAPALYLARTSNLNKVLDILAESGISKQDAEALLTQPSSRYPVTVARRWPMQKANPLARKLSEAGAGISVVDEDVRIYALTPETRAQVAEIIRVKQ